MRMVSYLSPGPLPGDDPVADGRADFGWICSTSLADQSWAEGMGVSSAGVARVPDDVDAAGCGTHSVR